MNHSLYHSLYQPTKLTTFNIPNRFHCAIKLLEIQLKRLDALSFQCLSMDESNGKISIICSM